ncbi:hypothetical protein COEREDRAFT_86349 [Coemansia reversa NRRL 1564]|uniref:Zn(2)-C6 fungal-type domain-containing protein n=1 Tax=Coemansia reversa (strain ATCC 12441 / NRRL 1564) TaxID=763665 RepID=A0A2G5BED7_COERN|nr:hypothetical protein COEREDRAFT_86349 [Coemansia reversa NRRL 1564]|eukprot:PIA17361.1 hypothetical protein COEREDRAFT_86349 [Coemansia reversa NRRL 1564]
MPKAAKGISEETVAGSPKKPGTERRPKQRRLKLDCLRCRLLGINCTGTPPCCDVCPAAGVDCLYFPETNNDVLFDAFPQRVRQQLARSIQRRPPADTWENVSASAEFLGKCIDDSLRTPECIDDFVENPARLRPAPELNRRVLGGQLVAALEEFPEQEGDRAPLPSSELLSCISNTFARAGAAGVHEPHSEHMGGGSLLAYGVLLQEYCRYLI